MKKTKNKKVELKTKSSLLQPKFLIIVFLFAFFGAYMVSQIFAATTSLTLVPSASTVNVGSNFTVAVRVNSGTDTVNAIQANLTYDSTKIQYVSVNETGSAFGLVAETTNNPGSLLIGRAVAGGGLPVSGDNLVTTVTFKSIATGSVPISFGTGSLVARSTDNINVLTVSNNTTVTVSDTVAPSVPASLAAPTISFTSINLTWAASTDNVGVKDYIIYRNNIQVGTSTTTSFNNTGLTPGTAYSFKVAARDAANNTSVQSTAFSATTTADTVAPSVPGTTTSSSQTMTSINLAWSASTDNVAVTGYRVYRNGILVGSPTATSYVDSGLTADTSYSYRIAAIDGSGNLSAQSIAVSFRTLADTVAPSVPSGLSATVSGKDVLLTWSASTDNVGVAQYVIYRNGIQVATSTTANYTVLNAPAGTSSYSVAARDAKGNTSTQSIAASVSVYAVADINKDTKVDILDLSIMLSNWSKTGPNTSDINGDSKVDVLDLSVLLSGWTG
jgi:chitodextrinase